MFLPLDDDFISSQVFSRLPVKELVNCLFVNHDCQRIIRARNFTNTYHNFSARRRCLLFAVPDVNSRWNFRQSDNDNHGTVTVSSRNNVAVNLWWRSRPESVCGLICGGDCPLLCDPISGIVRVFSPPEYDHSGKYLFLLGHDPVRDEYWFLLMWGSEWFSHFRVSSALSVRRDCEWSPVLGRRALVSSISNSKCFQGMLYFVADTELPDGNKETCLVQFLFQTASFKYFKFRGTSYPLLTRVVTIYRDKPTVLCGSIPISGTYRFTLHIAENLNESQWRTVPFSFNPSLCQCTISRTCVVGTTENTDEIIFQGSDTTTNKFCLVYVDLMTNVCRSFSIEGVEPRDSDFERRTIAFHHSDSLFFLKL